MSERRERRSFTDEFKKQVVGLYNAEKSRTEIIKEYDLSASAFNGWVKEFNTSGSFKAKDNRSEEERRILQLEKENKQLRMENDILKQAALIMGRK